MAVIVGTPQSNPPPPLDKPVGAVPVPPVPTAIGAGLEPIAIVSNGAPVPLVPGGLTVNHGALAIAVHGQGLAVLINVPGVPPTEETTWLVTESE